MSKRAFLTKTHLSRRDFLEKAAQAGAGLAGMAFLAACGSAAAPAGGDTGTTASTAASDAAASVAADAAPSAAAVAPEGGAGSISMMGWGSPLEKENVETGLKHFEEQNPDINVEWLHTPQDYPTKLKTMLAGGTPPDVFWANNMLDYVARGVVLDVTDKVKADPVLGKSRLLPPAAGKQTAPRINGKWYGIGSCWVVPHLYYNTAMLETAGVEPPSTDAAQAWTWDQFVEAAKQLTLDANGQHPGDADFDADEHPAVGRELADLVAAARRAGLLQRRRRLYRRLYLQAGRAGGGRGDPGAGRPRATSTRSRRRPRMTEQLGMNSMQMLASGKLAILADGSWALQDIAKLGFEYGCGVLPKMKEPMTAGTAHLHVISQNTENAEASWKLLAFLSSDDYQRGLCKVGLWLPSHTSLLTPDGLAPGSPTGSTRRLRADRHRLSHQEYQELLPPGGLSQKPTRSSLPRSIRSGSARRKPPMC